MAKDKAEKVIQLPAIDPEIQARSIRQQQEIYEMFVNGNLGVWSEPFYFEQDAGKRGSDL